MAGLALCQIAVHEIKVTDECAVVECRTVRGGLAAADQRTLPCASEIIGLGAKHPDGLSAERAERAANGVEEPDLDLSFRVIGNCIERCPGNELSEFLDLCHGVVHLAILCSGNARIGKEDVLFITGAPQPECRGTAPSGAVI